MRTALVALVLVLAGCHNRRDQPPETFDDCMAGARAKLWECREVNGAPTDGGVDGCQSRFGARDQTCRHIFPEATPPATLAECLDRAAGRQRECARRAGVADFWGGNRLPLASANCHLNYMEAERRCSVEFSRAEP